MPLKAQTKVSLIRQSFQLPAEMKDDLAQYSRMIDSDPDYIVEQALAKIFKEKAFLDWKQKNAPLEMSDAISKSETRRLAKAV